MAASATATVLCFGDSNTWGFDPRTGQRLAAHVRWPGVLRKELDRIVNADADNRALCGLELDVVESGQNGRTTVVADPVEGEHKRGLSAILTTLETAQPVNVCIVMLGTNDLKHRFNLCAHEIAQGASRVGEEVLRASRCGENRARAPKLLLIAPPPIHKNGVPSSCHFAPTFNYEGAHEKSRDVAKCLQTLAGFLGGLYGKDNVEFLDASSLPNCECSAKDGIHLEADAHHALGIAVAPKVAKLLGLTVQ